jgi:hypothetical protein
MPVDGHLVHFRPRCNLTHSAAIVAKAVEQHRRNSRKALPRLKPEYDREQQGAPEIFPGPVTDCNVNMNIYCVLCQQAMVLNHAAG